MPFLVDMARLFEVFTARWLEEHLHNQFIIRRQESFNIDENGTLSEVMDIVLYDKITHSPLCVLDTKYKIHKTVQPADYNQMIAYADALGCQKAILIYPTTLKQPLDAKKGNIRVKTAIFDLSQDLDISGQALLTQILGVVC